MLLGFVILIAVGFLQGMNAVAATNSAALYLSQFGYLKPDMKRGGSQKESLVDISNAVAEFQNFAGLDVTGELDDETLKTMNLSRCGVKDFVGSGQDSRSKRYALQGSRWKVKNLTYRISKYPKKLEKTAVDSEINKAFNVWSGFTDLTFRPVKTNPHIDIRFEYGEHGDGDPFDGPGGTLAHAYFPVYGGDAHFDAAEQWTIDSYRGTNLFQVASHEFGHSLGLSHSDVRSALMSPFYRGYEPVFELDQDDILGIQALYGKKSGRRPTPRPPPPEEDDDDDDDDEVGDESSFPNHIPGSSDEAQLCKDPKFDTIFTNANDEMFVFKGDNYWQLTSDKIMHEQPKKIKDTWKGLEGNIDAAFTYKNGKTYFFKGSRYWRFIGNNMESSYPKSISEGFTGIPDNIDAATVWSGNGKIYFYKGSKFWQFNPTQRPPVKSTYPKPVSNWEGVPNDLDGAMKDSNGYTYFFKDGAYYRFNDQAFAVDIVDPAFPRSTANWWFGCKGAPRGTLGMTGTRKNARGLAGGATSYDWLHGLSNAAGDEDGSDKRFNDAGLHQETDSEAKDRSDKDKRNSTEWTRAASNTHITCLLLLLLANRLLTSWT